MRLVDLEAKLVRHEMRGEREVMVEVDSAADAQGVFFFCPACFAANNGPIGTHSILVWFAGRALPDGLRPLPRWQVSGTGLHDLSLSPSINLDLGCGGCRWHGFVSAGEAR